MIFLLLFISLVNISVSESYAARWSAQSFAFLKEIRKKNHSTTIISRFNLFKEDIYLQVPRFYMHKKYKHAVFHHVNPFFFPLSRNSTFSFLSAPSFRTYCHMNNNLEEDGTSLDDNEYSSVSVNFKDVSFSRSTDIVVLEETDFSFNQGEKIVLVGENGVGKSTLLRLITGELVPDSGTISVKGRVGYLPQNPRLIDIKNIRDCFIHYLADPDLFPLLGKDSALISSSLMQEFNRKGGHIFSRTLHDISMSSYSQDFPFHRLSGGQKTKVTLAAILSVGFDLILLDEPTNHLDEESCKWLEAVLRTKRSWIIVSHDRMLINNTANAMLELTPDNHKLQKFRGGYSSYLVEKQKDYERKKQIFENQQKEKTILSDKLKTHQELCQKKVRGKRDNDKLAFNARGDGKQRSQRRIAGQLHEKIERIEKQPVLMPYKRKVVLPDFLENHQLEKLHLQVMDLCIEIEGRILLDKVNLSVSNGERLIIIGKNGSGKTTLLRTILGQLISKKGSIIASPSIKFGYLDQEQESIDQSLTLLEYCQGYSHKSRQEINEKLIRMGLFHPFEMKQKIATLSIGKQRKAQLACIMLSGANFLILDEPTNHIDIASMEQIESALLAFKGPIIAVSHDRWFINKIATKKMEL